MTLLATRRRAIPPRTARPPRVGHDSRNQVNNCGEFDSFFQTFAEGNSRTFQNHFCNQ
jgi:hypothetical protein